MVCFNMKIKQKAIIHDFAMTTYRKMYHWKAIRSYLTSVMHVPVRRSAHML